MSRLGSKRSRSTTIYRKYGEEYKPLGNMLNAQKAIIKGLLATIAAGGIHLLSKEAAAQAAVVVSAASLSLAKSRLATAGKDYYTAMKFLRKSIRKAHKGIKKSVEAKAAQSVKVAEKKIDEAEKINKEAAKATEEVKKVIKKETDPNVIEKAVASAKEAQDKAVKKTEEAVAAVASVVESTNEAAQIVEKEEKALDKQESEAVKKKAEEVKKTAQEAKNKAEEVKKTAQEAKNKAEEAKKSLTSNKTETKKSSTSSKGTQSATKKENLPVDLNATTELGVKIYYPSGRKKPKSVIEREEKQIREELEDVQKVNEKQAKREEQQEQQAKENQNKQLELQKKEIKFDDDEVKYIYDTVKNRMEEIAKRASLDKNALDWVAKNFANSDPLIKRSASIISSVINGRYLAERVCTRDKATVSNKQTIVEKSRRQSNAMESDGNYLFSLYRQIQLAERTLNENNKNIAKKAEESILSISQCISSLGGTLNELARYVSAEVPLR